MTRKLFTILAAAGTIAAASAPAASAAQVTKCSGKTYGGIDPSGFPSVSKLRAIDVPAKTDGYAPRCLVAETVAGQVQAHWHNHGPRVVWARGARWNGGHWRMSYRVVSKDEGTYAVITARHGDERITFEGGS